MCVGGHIGNWSLFSGKVVSVTEVSRGGCFKNPFSGCNPFSCKAVAVAELPSGSASDDVGGARYSEDLKSHRDLKPVSGVTPGLRPGAGQGAKR